MGAFIDINAADGHRLRAWRSEPSGKPRGGLIVIQEIFGVNSHIKAVADGYAADGYLVIAPAMFDRSKPGYDTGYSQDEIQAGLGLMQSLQWDNTLKDVAAALDNIKSAGKVGIVGYCWGGAVTWKSAARVAGLAAAVSYYGGGVPNMIDEQPKCPVLAHWGETDHAIALDGVRKFEAAHPGVVSHVYAGAGHGFNCDQRGSYHAESAKLARTRTLEFLAKHIG